MPSKLFESTAAPRVLAAPLVVFLAVACPRAANPPPVVDAGEAADDAGVPAPDSGTGVESGNAWVPGPVRWAATFDPGFAADSSRLGMDAAGNVYLSGQLWRQTDFDPGPGVELRAPPEGKGQGFLLKLNADGTFAWVQLMTPLVDVLSLGVAPDGQACLGGGYLQRLDVDFDPGPGTDIKPLSQQALDQRRGFITCFDTAGRYLWTRPIAALGGAVQSGVRELHFDAEGTLWAGGIFASEGDFDEGPGSDFFRAMQDETGEFYQTTFVLKSDEANTYYGTFVQPTVLFGLGLQSAGARPGGAVVLGGFWGEADLDPTAGFDRLFMVDWQCGGGAPFFTRTFSGFDAAGRYAWSFVLSGAKHEVEAFVVGPEGHAFFTAKPDWQGCYNAYGEVWTAPWDPSIQQRYGDTLLARLDPDGRPGWARVLACAGLDYDTAALDPRSGDVYLAGSLTAPCDLLGQHWGRAVATQAVGGESDGVLTKIDSSGKPLWSLTLGGPARQHLNRAVANAAGRVVVLGRFMGTTDLDFGEGEQLFEGGNEGGNTGATFLLAFDDLGGRAPEPPPAPDGADAGTPAPDAGPRCIAACSTVGKDCGRIEDGCGGFLNCGSCQEPLTCGGAGVENVCAQTPPRLLAGGLNHPDSIVLDAQAAYVGLSGDYYFRFVAPESPGSVVRVPRDGSAPQVLAQVSGLVEHLAQDEAFVYFTSWLHGVDDGKLQRVPKAGGPVETLIDGLPGATGIALEGEDVYVLAGRLLRVPRSGGEAQTVIDDWGCLNPESVVLEPERVYLACGNAEGQFNGSIVSHSRIGGSRIVHASRFESPRSLVVSGDSLYWVDGGTGAPFTRLATIRKDATNGQVTALANFEHGLGGLAPGPDGIYVAMVGLLRADTTTGAIARVPYAGAPDPYKPFFLLKELNHPSAVAADGDEIFWTELGNLGAHGTTGRVLNWR